MLCGEGGYEVTLRGAPFTRSQAQNAATSPVFTNVTTIRIPSPSASSPPPRQSRQDVRERVIRALSPRVASKPVGSHQDTLS